MDTCCLNTRTLQHTRLLLVTVSRGISVRHLKFNPPEIKLGSADQPQAILLHLIFTLSLDIQ
jgi:hypothetical protein